MRVNKDNRTAVYYGRRHGRVHHPTQYNEGYCASTP